MTGLWCLAAHWLVNRRRLRGPIRCQAHKVAPFVLIGLGVLILIRTGALRSGEAQNSREVRLNLAAALHYLLSSRAFLVGSRTNLDRRRSSGFRGL
jgi:hypothetical protein